MTAPVRQLNLSDVMIYSICAPHKSGGVVFHKNAVIAVNGEFDFLGGCTFYQVHKFCQFRGWAFEPANYVGRG